MVEEFYLSRECCESLDLSYEEQREETTVEPSKLLMLRHDWDRRHKETLHTFIFAEQNLRLQPVWRSFGHARGWYKILNPPNTRYFVTTDIDVDILTKQRNLLLDVCNELDDADSHLISGVISMVDSMLDAAKDQSG